MRYLTAPLFHLIKIKQIKINTQEAISVFDQLIIFFMEAPLIAPLYPPVVRMYIYIFFILGVGKSHTF